MFKPHCLNDREAERERERESRFNLLQIKSKTVIIINVIRFLLDISFVVYISTEKTINSIKTCEIVYSLAKLEQFRNDS